REKNGNHSKTEFPEVNIVFSAVCSPDDGSDCTPQLTYSWRVSSVGDTIPLVDLTNPAYSQGDQWLAIANIEFHYSFLQ
ncbi:MAG: hypothetical protein ACK56I_20950, partial [bacterium]